MKRIIVLESENREMIDRFADKCDREIEKPMYDDVCLTHYVEDN